MVVRGVPDKKTSFLSVGGFDSELLTKFIVHESKPHEQPLVPFRVCFYPTATTMAGGIRTSRDRVRFGPPSIRTFRDLQQQADVRIGPERIRGYRLQEG